MYKKTSFSLIKA